MRNLAERTLRSAIALGNAGKPREEIARLCKLKLEVVDLILAGKVTPAEVRRRPIPTRRCPRCDARINLWPCRYCVPNVLNALTEETSDAEEGLTSSQEERKAEVDNWRKKYGHPRKNAEHPLHGKRKKS